MRPRKRRTGSGRSRVDAESRWERRRAGAKDASGIDVDERLSLSTANNIQRGSSPSYSLQPPPLPPRAPHPATTTTVTTTDTKQLIPPTRAMGIVVSLDPRRRKNLSLVCYTSVDGRYSNVRKLYSRVCAESSRNVLHASNTPWTLS